MTFNSLVEDLDRLVRTIMGRILDRFTDTISIPDRKRILDTLVYQLRGIEQSIRGAISVIDTEKIEQDLDYLIGMIISRRAHK